MEHVFRYVSRAFVMITLARVRQVPRYFPLNYRPAASSNVPVRDYFPSSLRPRFLLASRKGASRPFYVEITLCILHASRTNKFANEILTCD